MYKFLLLLFFLPFCSFAQEQVSDVKNYGNTEPTDVFRKIGFTVIDSVQYVLKIKDSLIIYRLENEKLMYHGAIKKLSGNLDSYYSISQNRSWFRIVDGILYRFYGNGLQIIDIKKAQLLDEYDLSSNNYYDIEPIEVFNRKFTFTPSFSSNRIKYILDLDTREVSKLTLADNRVPLIHLKNKIASIASSKNIFLYDVDTEADSLIYEAANGVNYFSYSPQDSSFNFLDKSNTLWKIDKNLTAKNTHCILPTKNLKHLALNGNKAILITETKYYTPRIDSVIVYDVNTCSIDLTFKTAERESFAYNFEFIPNEYAEKDVSIFGYYGTHPADGLDEGLYYIINHRNNTAIPVREISRIQTYTPFVHLNSMYCVGVNTSFWSSNQFLLKINLEDNSISKPSPYALYTNKSVALGYFYGEDLVLASNIYDELPSLMFLKNDLSFSLIENLDFRINLGVHSIGKLIPEAQRLFFTCNFGLYSMLDDCRLEASFNNISKLQSYNFEKPTAVYKNKIAFAEADSKKIVFKIFDSQSGNTDSLVLKTKVANSLLGVGPFIFYKKETTSNPASLEFFDLKTNKVFSTNNLEYISTYGLIENGNNAIYYQYGKKLYLIDFETNNIDLIDIKIDPIQNIIAGYDGSYYIIDKAIGADKSRIRLLKKNKEISTIYYGPGTYTYSARDSDSPLIIMAFIDPKHSFIVSNDLVKTDVPEIDQNDQLSLLNANKNKFIVSLKDSSGIHYLLYEAFRPLVKLFSEPLQNLRVSSLNDSFAIFVTGNKIFSLTKIDLNTFISNKVEITNINGNFRYLFKAYNLNNHQILLNTLSDKGYEPGILDIDIPSITSAVDINPGAPSSHPTNYIKYKNWVYFTAITEDNSTQWFRVHTGLSTPTIEKVTGPLSLSIFPSPACQEIVVDKDLEEVSIYDVSGQLRLYTKDYKSKQQLSIGHLPNGMYFLTGSFKSNHFSSKFVVAH